MIIELPNFVSLDTLSKIKESVQPFVSKSKQNIERNREGVTVNISKEQELKDIDSLLHDIFIKVQYDVLAYKYKPVFLSGDTGYEYHLYRPGDICHIHGDGEFSTSTNPNQFEALIRYASVVLHLNTPQDGGELVFPAQNKKIKTEIGKIVIFPPYHMYQHYTTPSTDTREVIVTWFVYQDLKVVKNANPNI